MSSSRHSQNFAKARLQAEAICTASSLGGLAGTQPYPSLGLCLAALRTLQHLYQTFHWQAKGDNSYEDHLLFMRLYEKVSEEVDSVGERVVGLNGNLHVDPIAQLKMMGELLPLLQGQEGSLAMSALRAENIFMRFREFARVGASDGTTNLLDDIADSHETHIYLLKQRAGV